MNLKDKVVIVTGAGGGGTGRATAQRFPREGALVVVNSPLRSPRSAIRTIFGSTSWSDALCGRIMVWWNECGGTGVVERPTGAPDSRWRFGL
jgi:NAD(P)-dependent dehydrogenase (short-subunit alcohol dehydrogenase family)